MNTPENNVPDPLDVVRDILGGGHDAPLNFDTEPDYTPVPPKEGEVRGVMYWDDDEGDWDLLPDQHIGGSYVTDLDGAPCDLYGTQAQDLIPTLDGVDAHERVAVTGTLEDGRHFEAVGYLDRLGIYIARDITPWTGTDIEDGTQHTLYGFRFGLPSFHVRLIGQWKVTVSHPVCQCVTDGEHPLPDDVVYEQSGPFILEGQHRGVYIQAEMITHIINE